MTRLAEIGHVLIKDVREARRLALLYLAVVVVATAHAVGVGAFGAATFGLSMVFVVLVGALLAASAIQADSPTRTDAFWATHPFRRSSMLAAKVAFAALIVLVATIAQVIAVRSYDLAVLSSNSLVVGPALLFGAALLLVMVLASVTSDLRSFLLTAIAIPLVVLIMANLRWIRELWEPLQVLGPAAAAALLVWLYLTRDGRRRTRVATVGVIALTLMSTCANEVTRSAPEREIAAPPPLIITLEPAGPGPRSQPGELPFVLHVTGTEKGMRARLDLSWVEIRLRDGSVVHAPVTNGRIEVAGELPGYTDAPGFRWLGEVPLREVRTQVTPLLTAGQRRALADGVAGVAIDARVSVWESRVSNAMPLVAGAEATESGRRTRVVEWTPDDAVSLVTVDAASIDTVPDSDRPPLWMLGKPGFALVNESRREAALLHRAQSSGSIDGLVLPGTPFESGRLHLGLGQVTRWDVALLDTAWLRGARLAQVTSRFRGAYGVRLEMKSWPGVATASRIPLRAAPLVYAPGSAITVYAR